MKNRKLPPPFRSIAAICILCVLVLLTWPTRSHLQDRAEPLDPEQTYIVTNLNGSGAGSLQQAITDANNHAGLDTINFNVPGSGIQFLFTSAPLPTITDPVVIDATTQPGYAGTPLIHMEGMGTGQAFNVTSGGTTIKGLSFTSFFAGATNGIIKLSGPGNNVITGCAFGVRGDSTRPTTASIGVLIDSSNNNRVGGTTAAERNYFAVTNEQSLVIQNGASGNRVTGNWFGTGPNGTRMSTIGRDAIRILNSPNNTIGGSTGTTPGGACTGECNVIDGAGNNGLWINGNAASGNRVIGNFVGLFPNGSSVNQNNLGLRIENAPNNTVGGTTAGERNVVTGNDGLAGILVTGAGSTGTVITGNYIGLYSNGTSTPPVANVSLDGILVNAGAANVRIGGVTAGERNVISGLRVNGIELAGASGNTVLGNYIGTDASGMVRSTTIGNGLGLFLSDNNTIGGTTNTTLGGACTGACNVISGNGNDGTSSGILLNTSNSNSIDANYIGLNVAGTTAMLNGRTQDGSVYNGRAIGVYSSSNNTIGNRAGPDIPERSPDVPLTFYCVQDPDTGDYVSFSDVTHTYEAKHCKSGRSLTGMAFVTADTGSFIRIQSDTFGLGTASLTQGSRGWGFGHFPDPDGFSFIAQQNPPFDRSCECPHNGMNTIGGPVELGHANEPANNNYAQLNLMGKKANGVSSLDEFYPTRSSIIVSLGSNNVFRNNDISSGPDSSIDIRGGSGNTVGDVRAETTGMPVSVAAGANNGILPPTQMVFARFATEEVGIRMTGTFQGLPNQQYEIRIWGVYYTYVGDLPIPNFEPLEIPVTVMTDGAGFANIDVTFIGPEYEVLSSWGGNNLAVNATQITGGSSSALTPNIPFPSPLFDFDRDGKTDLTVYRPGAGLTDRSYWYIFQSRDSTVRAVQFGSGGDLIVPGDFNNDQRTDLGVYRPSNGTWYFSRFSGDPSTNFDAIQWGLPTDRPIFNFDYDADGRKDAAVFRPSNGTWYIRGSLGGYTYARQWGLPADTLAPADYNGDGRSDVAVFRSGTWYISTCPTCPVRYEFFGTNGDIPVPGDFDGDGKADIAVWRPSDGNWYIQQSKLGFAAIHWGLSNDIPLNVDTDADGKNDIAIWRPSTGDWWVLQSSNNQSFGSHWGQPGDVPIPKF